MPLRSLPPADRPPAQADADAWRRAFAEHLAAGDISHAEKTGDQLLAAASDDAERAYTLATLGALAGCAGRHALAAHYLAGAGAQRPDHPPTLHNHGEALRQTGDLARAGALFRRVLELDAGFLPAYASLRQILASAHAQALAQGDEQQIAGLADELCFLANNHGNCLLDGGQLGEAIASYRHALTLRPNHANALSNLANALRQTGQVGESERLCRQAISINPRLAQAWNNLGIALSAQGRADEASDAYKTALALWPECPEALHNEGSGSLSTLLYRADLSSGEISERHRQWGKRYPRPSVVPHRSARLSGRRLRVAYLSPDFREHAMLHFLEPILAHHDRQQFDITCYAQGPAHDDHTQRLMRYGQRWVWIHVLDDAALAATIASDRIDLLIDCTGHTLGTRLAALADKPAPLMMSWLGYLGATGLPAIDYRLTDDWVDPPEFPVAPGEEAPLRIPGGMLAYRPHQRYPEVAEPPSTSRAGITFGSLNNIAKFNAATARLWAAILDAVPDSRLLLQTKQLVDPGTAGWIRGLFEAFGIAARRLDLRPASADFLATYAEIDIALDTSPFGGGATSCDALWMGVPVVTLAGERPCGRLTTSILEQIDRPEWIAASPESYVRLACQLAARRHTLATIRRTLREQMRASTLCDESGFVRRLERVYLAAAQRHDQDAA